MELKPSILIVEDDKKIREIINNGLSTTFNIHMAPTCTSAYEEISKNDFEVVCLDIGLPDGNGLEICRYLKSKKPNVSVIVLSKKSLIQDRLSAFNTGADDYVAKPFFIEELRARVLNQIKHHREIKGPGVSYNLDTDKGKFICKYGTISLTKTETIVMHAIISSSIRYVTIDNILQHFSTYTLKIPSGEATKVTISRINSKFRRILGVTPIRSKYGFGYYIKL